MAGGGGGGASSEDAGAGFDFFSLLDSARSADLTIVVAIIAILIGLNFIWEFINEALESALEHHKHILQMIHKLWGELTILGLWSMILFLIQRSFNVDGHLKHIFEYVHFSLFLLSILYILMVVFMALLSAIIFRRWRQLEKFDANQVHIEHDQRIAERAYRSRWWLLSHPRFAWKYYQSSVQDDYHMIRSHFVEQHSVGEKFPFDKYLKRCMKGIFSELSQVKWFVLATVLLLQFGLWMPFEMVRREHNVPFAMFCVIEVIVNSLLFAKSFSIVKFLKKHRHILTEPQHVLNRKLKMTLAQMRIKQQTEQHAQAARANREEKKKEKRRSRAVTFQQQETAEEKEERAQNHQSQLHPGIGTPDSLPDLERGAKHSDEESSIQFAEIEYHTPSQQQQHSSPTTHRKLSSSGHHHHASAPAPPPKLIRADSRNQLRSTGDLFPQAGARVLHHSNGANHVSSPQQQHQQQALRSSNSSAFDDEILPARKGSLSPEQLVQEAERIRSEKLTSRDDGDDENADDGYASYTSSSESESEDEPEFIDEEDDQNNDNANNNTVTSTDMSSPPRQPAGLGSSGIIRTKVRHHHHHHHHHHFHANAAELFVAWKSHEKKKSAMHFEEFHWLKGCLWPLLRCKPEQLCIDLPSSTNQHNDHRHYTAHTNLFWFNSPRFFLVLMQMLLFFEATYLAIQVASLAQIIEVTVWYLPLPLLLTLFNICLLMPGTIYNYSIAVNVGEFTKEDIMDEVQQKLAAQQREEAKKHSDRHKRHRNAAAAARKVAGQLNDSLQHAGNLMAQTTQDVAMNTMNTMQTMGNTVVGPVQDVVLRPVQNVLQQVLNPSRASGAFSSSSFNPATGVMSDTSMTTALSGGYFSSPPNANTVVVNNNNGAQHKGSPILSPSLKLVQSGELTPPATPQSSLGRTFLRKHRRVTSAPVDAQALEEILAEDARRLKEEEQEKDTDLIAKKQSASVPSNANLLPEPDPNVRKHRSRPPRRSVDLRRATDGSEDVPVIKISSDPDETNTEKTTKKNTTAGTTTSTTAKPRSHSHEHVHHHHHHNHD